MIIKTEYQTRLGGRTPLIPELERQREVDLCEFKGSLFYVASFRETLSHKAEVECQSSLNCPHHLPIHTAKGRHKQDARWFEAGTSQRAELAAQHPCYTS